MNRTIEIMTVVYGKKAKEMITKCSKKAGFELQNHDATSEQIVQMLNSIINGKGKSEIRQLAKIELDKIQNANSSETEQPVQEENSVQVA